MCFSSICLSNNIERWLDILGKVLLLTIVLGVKIVLYLCFEKQKVLIFQRYILKKKSFFLNITGRVDVHPAPSHPPHGQPLSWRQDLPSPCMSYVITACMYECIKIKPKMWYTKSIKKKQRKAKWRTDKGMVALRIFGAAQKWARDKRWPLRELGICLEIFPIQEVSYLTMVGADSSVVTGEY